MKKTYSAVLKFKTALAALTGRPITEICKEYEVTDKLVHRWKKELKERGAEVFSDRKATMEKAHHLEQEKLYQRIGQLSVENEFLKKIVGDSV